MPGGITGHPFTGGHKYRDLVLQVGCFDARLKTLLCKKIIVLNSKEVQTGWSKEGYGPKRAVLPMMMLMTIMIIIYII
jgi:hypothetical protein